MIHHHLVLARSILNDRDSRTAVKYDRRCQAQSHTLEAPICAFRHCLKARQAQNVMCAVFHPPRCWLSVIRHRSRPMYTLDLSRWRTARCHSAVTVEHGREAIAERGLAAKQLQLGGQCQRPNKVPNRFRPSLPSRFPHPSSSEISVITYAEIKDKCVENLSSHSQSCARVLKDVITQLLENEGK